MSKCYNPNLRKILMIGSLAQMLLILTACSTVVTTPVVTVVERTVLVVLTATNPPATDVPTLAHASATPAQSATTAPSATPAASSTPTSLPPSPTPEETSTATKAPTRTPGVLPTVVPISQVSMPGIIPGTIRYLPTASIQMNLQYSANQAPAGPKVSNVTFTIFFGATQVFQSTDDKAPYCAFGDDGTKCNTFIFDDYVNTWPGTHISIQDGTHSLRVRVQDDESPSNSWKLDIPFNVKLP
jgi:hypothetical protein